MDNLFEIGAKFEDGWSSDNKTKAKKNSIIEIKEPNKHNLSLAKEKRRGKSVTIVKEFYLEDKALKELLKSLKKRLGCGGTIKQYSLEFQGDISNKLKEELSKKGFRFKK